MEGTTDLTRGAAIGRGTAAMLTAVFLVFLAVPPVHQFIHERRSGRRWGVLALFGERPTRESLKAFEETLARDSALAAGIRAPYQALGTRWFRQGNEKVVVGPRRWLFYRREVEMAFGRGFLSRPRAGAADPVAAIVDFHRRLRARGIRLLFVPIPLKPFLHPEEVWEGYPVPAGPAWNTDRDSFRERLAGEGVEVVDVTDDLWAAKREGPVCLRNDTHWTPRGMEAAADRIAGHARPSLGDLPRREFVLRPETVTGRGDLLRLLEAGPGSGLDPEETVVVRRVLRGGAPVRGGDEARVLLLGDSFTNVYSQPRLGWGEGAGLGEHLAARLGVEVQILAVDGGGATAVRETLAARPAALRKKKIVVWACSARDLDDVDVRWDIVPLPEERP